MDDISISSLFNEIKALLQGVGNKRQPTSSNKSPSISNITTKYQVPIKTEYHNSGGFDPTGHGSVGRVHQGLDLRAPGGSSLYPIAPGEVVAVRTDPKGGNTVNVKHSDGLTSYYAHLGTISCQNGDKLSYNDILGTVGGSGNANGFPHLHLQIWRNGTLIDPASIISVPQYTNFNNKTEKLWLPGAKETAQNWNIQKHLQSKKQMIANRADELVSLADRFLELTMR